MPVDQHRQTNKGLGFITQEETQNNILGFSKEVEALKRGFRVYKGRRIAVGPPLEGPHETERRGLAVKPAEGLGFRV